MSVNKKGWTNIPVETQAQIEEIGFNVLQDLFWMYQSRFCTERKVPLFAYKTCPKCDTDLAIGLLKNRTIEQAKLKCTEELITGCPNCGMTWCD